MLTTIFLSALILDLLWAWAVDAIRREQAGPAALASGLVAACSLGTTLVAVRQGDAAGVVAFALGSGLGTYLYVKWRK